jgi:hypothetical protein
MRRRTYGDTRRDAKRRPVLAIWFDVMYLDIKTLTSGCCARAT